MSSTQQTDTPGEQDRLLTELIRRAWRSLPDLRAARLSAEALAAWPGERAALASALLVLELALRGEARARDELPGRVGALRDAARDPARATALVDGVPELRALWERAFPVVLDFLRQHAPAEPLVADGEDIDVLEELVEEPPPPPPRARPRGDLEEHRAFWAFTLETLGTAATSRIGPPQAFDATSANGRAELARFADELMERHPLHEQARALAGLVRLYLGARDQKGIRRAHRDRRELIHAGLSLLGDVPTAARVAVLFETDGQVTREKFGNVVELMLEYLGFCARERLDPLGLEAPARFAGIP